MDDPIELPAESIPFNGAALQQVLGAGVSSDQHQVHRATDQLKAWETKEGFYSLLQDVFIDKSLPISVRLLAITQIKNGVDKYWRRSATNAIRPTERTRIRSRLLESGLSEGNEQLANFNAIATAKIARFDFPGQWPDLIKDLINILRLSADSSAPRTLLSRSLLIALDLIKELSTVRLQRARAAFLSAAPELFETLSRVYVLKVDEWQQLLSASQNSYNEEILSRMRESERTLKIIRRLFVAGFDFPDRDDTLRNFWATTRSHVKQYQNLIIAPQLSEKYVELLGNHLKQIAKLHLNTARDHPISFALLPDAASLIHDYWTSANAWRRQQLDSPSAGTSWLNQTFEAFNLRAMLILRACLKTATSPVVSPFKYKSSQGKDDPPKAREYLKTQVFSDGFIKDILEKSVTFFLVMLPSDIEEWISEPEEWEMKDEGDESAYEQSVRSCAERLLLDICVHYKDLVMNDLLSLASHAKDIAFQIPAKDAIFATIGVAAPILQKKFDFNSFLTTTLVSELQSQDRSHTLIRRRIAILLAQWISVDVSEANRPLVYQIYQHLLDRDVAANELPVRITAGKRFCDVVNEWEFKAEAFSPFAPTILSQLIALMQEVDLEDTQIALLSTVGAVVERMEHQVKPFAEQIVSLLPPLWNASARAHLMKQSIVTVLTKLVNALEADSSALQSIVLPIVKDAIQPGSPTQMFLLDDALDLWSAVVTQAEAPASPDLLSLVPLLSTLFELETSTIEKALRIQESYILLAPSEMVINEQREDFFHAATSLLNVKKPNIIDAVTGNVELAIRAAEALGQVQALNVVVNGLWEIGFLSHAINSIHTNWQSHQTTGPNKKEPPHDWKNESDYFAVLSRIILARTDTFLALIQSWAALRDLSFDDAISRILDEWFGHMDAVISPPNSKLLCLGITKLLETGQRWSLLKLQDFMSLWSSVLLELQDGEDDKGGDSLVYSQSELPLNGAQVPEQARRRAVMFSDPVHTINLAQFVKHHLSNAVAQCGGEQQFQEQWLANVDKEVVKSFSELGIM